MLGWPLYINKVYSYGPISFEEAYQKDLPLYYPVSPSNYVTLNLTIYYKTRLERLTVDTYFTIENSHKLERVARIKTYRNQYISGLKMLDSFIITSWAPKGVRACEVKKDASGDDQISGIPYQSCFFWRNGNDDNLLYTVWTKDEAENFVKSLIKNEK